MNTININKHKIKMEVNKHPSKQAAVLIFCYCRSEQLSLTSLSLAFICSLSVFGK